MAGKLKKETDAAYTELREATSLTQEDISLYHLMDLTYYFYDYYLEVYVGRLKRYAAVEGEGKERYWSKLNENYWRRKYWAYD